MGNQNMAPSFGGKLKTDDYYTAVTTYIQSLRRTTTQRQIAAMLNSAGYRSPTGKPFVRSTVSNFLRKRSI
jgi:hypothetical protein